MNACIVRVTKDKKVLLVKHREREWEFPGGKIDFSKDKFENTEIIDLQKCAIRELHEEVSENIECEGMCDKVLYESNHRTVFFVYCNQPSLSDYYVTQDDAISEIRQFDVSDIDSIIFSFENDKHLLKTIL